MPLFVGTYENKVDKKGRVSVPARFRAALSGESFNGIVAYPAFDGIQAIEASGIGWLEQLSGRLNSLNPFSPGHRTLATAIFGRSLQLPFDDEGRVILPQEFLNHAGITERATFVALGRTFLIWDPKTYEAFAREVGEQAARESVRLDPSFGRDPTEGGR
ncbi:MAG: hypothetical protein V3V17_07180 [Alphaproteobacteria bacterium]|nr:hypothetical protein [Pseudomonadota bacterium]